MEKKTRQNWVKFDIKYGQGICMELKDGGRRLVNKHAVNNAGGEGNQRRFFMQTENTCLEQTK